MSRLDFGAKQLYLRALLWGGVMFGSLCDDLLPGQMGAGLFVLEARPPMPTDTSIETSVVTITTTVKYKPSPIPGEPQYTILGCYSPPSRDKGGRIFGVDERVMNSAKVQPNNLTIEGCLQECSSATPLDKSPGHYTYAGLLNGEKCICGLQLSTGSQKLPATECNIPCPGDQRLWCGGLNKVFIYGLTPEDDVHIQGTHSTVRPTSTETPTRSSTTGTERGAVTAQPADAGSETNSPHSAGSSSGPPGRHISVPTIAAISGSLTAVVLAAAGLFLCYRAHKRKKRGNLRDDTHVRSTTHGRRSIPSPIILTGVTSSSSSTSIFGVHQQEHQEHHIAKEGGSSAGSDGSGPDDDEGRRAPDLAQDEEDRDLVPATPALETGVGTGIPAGLHSRRATLEGRQQQQQHQQTSYTVFARDVRSGPASPHAQDAAGASSAVQWRPNNSNDTYAVTAMMSPTWTWTSSAVAADAAVARGRAMSSSHIPMRLSSASARVDDSNDRIWHRKLSTPYRPTPPPPPQQPTDIGIAIGDPFGDAIVASERVNIARREPPTGPPGTLPPAPPPPTMFGMQTRSRSRSRSRAVIDRLPPGDPGVRSATRLLPPRRSSDTTAITPSPAPAPAGRRANDAAPAVLTTTAANVPLAAPIPRGIGEVHPLGMCNPNASTPALGRYGSITKGRPPRTESPVLGWLMSDGRNPWGSVSSRERKKARDGSGADVSSDAKRPVIPPVLPPISPGEQFDHNRWKGTIYSPPDDEVGDDGDKRGAARRGEDDTSSESVSSVGTSILFSS